MWPARLPTQFQDATLGDRLVPKNGYDDRNDIPQNIEYGPKD
jgi:hypothetical protein